MGGMKASERIALEVVAEMEKRDQVIDAAVVDVMRHVHALLGKALDHPADMHIALLSVAARCTESTTVNMRVIRAKNALDGAGKAHGSQEAVSNGRGPQRARGRTGAHKASA
jgi:hypothetical protein